MHIRFPVKLIMTLLFFFIAMPIKASAMTIVLDPGHGGFGSAGSGAIYQPYVEKELNFSLASIVRDELEDAGYTVYMTREGDMPLSLEERASYAASLDADLLISLHFNSSGPHDKSGCEVWTSMFEPYYSKGRDIGSSILNNLYALGFVYKGVKTRAGQNGDYYGIIRHCASYGIPAIIVEHCFIDHPYDRALLDDVGIEALAHADAMGIIDALGSAEHPVKSSDSELPYVIPVSDPSDGSPVHPIHESKTADRELSTGGLSTSHRVE